MRAKLYWHLCPLDIIVFLTNNTYLNQNRRSIIIYLTIVSSLGSVIIYFIHIAIISVLLRRLDYNHLRKKCRQEVLQE